MVVQGLTIERGENGIARGAAIDASQSDLTLTEVGATAEVHRASFVNNHVGGFNFVMLNGVTVMSNVVLADNTFSTTIGGGVLVTSSTFYGSNLLLEVPTFVLAFRGDGATVHSSMTGDPRDAWKDADGSRNDCGPYGGPEG